MRRRSSRSASAAEKNGPNSIVKRADGVGVAGGAIAAARGTGADGGADVATAEGTGAVGGGAEAGGAAGDGTRAGAVTDGGVSVGGMIDVAGGAAGGAVGGALGGVVVAGATGAGVTGVDAAGVLGGGAAGGVVAFKRGAPGRGGAVGVADGLRRWRSSSRGFRASIPPERHTRTAASAPTAPSRAARARIRFLERPRPPVSRGGAFAAGGSVATDSPAPSSPFTAAAARPRPNQPSAWSTARCTRPPPPRGDSPGVSSP